MTRQDRRAERGGPYYAPTTLAVLSSRTHRDELDEMATNFLNMDAGSRARLARALASDYQIMGCDPCALIGAVLKNLVDTEPKKRPPHFVQDTELWNQLYGGWDNPNESTVSRSITPIRDRLDSFSSMMDRYCRSPYLNPPELESNRATGGSDTDNGANSLSSSNEDVGEEETADPVSKRQERARKNRGQQRKVQEKASKRSTPEQTLSQPPPLGPEKTPSNPIEKLLKLQEIYQGEPILQEIYLLLGTVLKDYPESPYPILTPGSIKGPGEWIPTPVVTPGEKVSLAKGPVPHVPGTPRRRTKAKYKQAKASAEYVLCYLELRPGKDEEGKLIATRNIFHPPGFRVESTADESWNVFRPTAVYTSPQDLPAILAIHDEQAAAHLKRNLHTSRPPTKLDFERLKQGIEATSRGGKAIAQAHGCQFLAFRDDTLTKDAYEKRRSTRAHLENQRRQVDEEKERLRTGLQYMTGTSRQESTI